MLEKQSRKLLHSPCVRLRSVRYPFFVLCYHSRPPDLPEGAALNADSMTKLLGWNKKLQLFSEDLRLRREMRKSQVSGGILIFSVEALSHLQSRMRTNKTIYVSSWSVSRAPISEIYVKPLNRNHLLVFHPRRGRFSEIYIHLFPFGKRMPFYEKNSNFKAIRPFPLQLKLRSGKYDLLCQSAPHKFCFCAKHTDL